MRKFDLHYDAGHAWLKVHVYDARNVGLEPEDFTAHSYRKGDYLYLEEDCDAGHFLGAWGKSLRPFDVREIADGYRSPIRSYEHIIPARQSNDDILF